METKKPKVVIVGAGMAGFAAAYELCKAGDFDVEILEARNYVGGRVRSVSVEDQLVDMGGFMIYPWYEEFHRLSKELGLENEMMRLPVNTLYYELDAPGEYISGEDVKFRMKGYWKFVLSTLPKFFRSHSLSQPNLNIFHKDTVSDFVRKSQGQKKGRLEKYIDIILQGYTFGPASKYKMSFVAPMIKHMYLYGTAKDSFFFGGDSSFVLAIKESIRDMGGKIRLGTEVLSVKKKTVVTNKGEIKKDYVIFSQPAHEKLYTKILPGISFGCEYTHYYSGILKFKHSPVVNNQEDWSAVFYEPHPKKKYEILSSVNLVELYSDSFEGFVSMSIVAREPAGEAISKDEMFDLLKVQIQKIFPDEVCKGIVKLVHWPEAMPIAQEKFVAEVRERQGENGYYFAGDYLGAPSMETAIQTGLDAARRLTRDASDFGSQ